jgi:hypothetical protein
MRSTDATRDETARVFIGECQAIGMNSERRAAKQINCSRHFPPPAIKGRERFFGADDDAFKTRS